MRYTTRLLRLEKEIAPRRKKFEFTIQRLDGTEVLFATDNPAADIRRAWQKMEKK